MPNNTPIIPNPMSEIDGRKVLNFATSGINTALEGSRDTDAHADHEQMEEARKADPVGIRVKRIAGNSMRQ